MALGSDFYRLVGSLVCSFDFLPFPHPIPSSTPPAAPHRLNVKLIRARFPVCLPLLYDYCYTYFLVYNANKLRSCGQRSRRSISFMQHLWERNFVDKTTGSINYPLRLYKQTLVEFDTYLFGRPCL